MMSQQGALIAEIYQTQENERSPDQKQQLLDWETDVREMFLSNPNFPNAYEFYTALKVISWNFSKTRERDIKPLLESMEKIEAGLINSFVIQPQQTCSRYADQNRDRAKAKPNYYKDPNATSDRHAPLIREFRLQEPERKVVKTAPAPTSDC
jgi:hypothetical protein